MADHADGTRPLEPRQRESDRVEDALRRMILTLELPPGAPISEGALAQRLGCGRTPLREALQRLESQYLVESAPHRGVSIAGLNVMDFAALDEGVPDIEAICVRLAAKRISDRELEQLDAIVAAAFDAGGRRDASALALADFDFHAAIARATRNHYLADTMIRLHAVAARFACMAWQQAASATESWEEHKRVVDALRAHDVPCAVTMVHEHYTRSMRRDAAAIGILPNDGRDGSGLGT